MTNPSRGELVPGGLAMIKNCESARIISIHGENIVYADYYDLLADNDEPDPLQIEEQQEQSA